MSGSRPAGLAAALTSAPKRRTPTAEQAAIIEAAKAGHRVVVVQAGAGTGKSSTCEMVSQSLGGRGQYTAFNSPLCAEAKGKMPSHVAVNTIHSLAFRAEGHKYKRRLNTGRVKAEDVAKMLGIEAIQCNGKRFAPGFLAGMVLAAVRRFCNSADAEVAEKHFAYQDGLDMPGPDGKRQWDNNNQMRAALLPHARRAWADMVDPNGRLPFSHDCYAKIWELNNPVIAADYLLVDESQDLVPRDISIIRKQRCQVILVGDSAQTIYAWRGCEDAMDQFPDAPQLFLSQSFRFGPAIAAVANAVLETLDEPTALRLKGLESIESTVTTSALPPDTLGHESGGPRKPKREGTAQASAAAKQGEAVSNRPARGGTPGSEVVAVQSLTLCILCRTNACAVANLLAAMADGKRPFLVGGGADVIAFVEGALALREGRGTQHPELACFGSWGEVEEYSKLEEGSDLLLMVKLIKEFGCRAIIDALRRMPEERDADPIISTAHKSKGREWDHVRLASDFPTKSKCRDPERKLLYVAVTRAKLTLDVSGCPFFTGQDSLDVSTKKGANEAGFGATKPLGLQNRGSQEFAVANDVGKPRIVPPSGGAQATVGGGVQAGSQDAASPQTSQSSHMPQEFTWSKKDGRWLIRGASRQTGVVTVTRKNGSTSRERLGRAVWENGEIALYEPAGIQS